MVPCQIRKTTKKKHPLRVGKKYVETQSSSHAKVPDPEQRLLHHTQRKSIPTVQFLKLKHKDVTSATDKRRMMSISRQTPK